MYSLGFSRKALKRHTRLNFLPIGKTRSIQLVVASDARPMKINRITPYSASSRAALPPAASRGMTRRGWGRLMLGASVGAASLMVGATGIRKVFCTENEDPYKLGGAGGAGGTVALRLDEYQQADGLITTFKANVSEVADPYFGLFGLVLAHRAGLDTSQVGAGVLSWGLKAQREDGRFERFCGTPGALTSCGRSDSDDATLARWLQVVAQEAPRPWSAEVAESFKRAFVALQALRMRNGVYSVYPHDTPGYEGYALFKDNVEVLNALEALSHSPALKDDPVLLAQVQKAAKKLRPALHAAFGSGPTDFEVLALGASYAEKKFYPHHVAAPFAWAETYVTSAPLQQREHWLQWLREHQGNWEAFAQKDYPWGLLALGAVQAGLPEVGKAWLERTQAQRKANERWNVLEEICAQALELMLSRA